MISSSFKARERFHAFVEHSPENSRRLRDDLPECCDLAREGNSERKLA